MTVQATAAQKILSYFPERKNRRYLKPDEYGAQVRVFFFNMDARIRTLSEIASCKVSAIISPSLLHTHLHHTMCCY